MDVRLGENDATYRNELQQCPCCEHRASSVHLKPRLCVRWPPWAMARNAYFSTFRDRFQGPIHGLYPECYAGTDGHPSRIRDQPQPFNSRVGTPRHTARPGERCPPATTCTLFPGSAGTKLHHSVVSKTRASVKSMPRWTVLCFPPPLPRAAVVFYLDVAWPLGRHPEVCKNVPCIFGNTYANKE